MLVKTKTSITVAIVIAARDDTQRAVDDADCIDVSGWSRAVYRQGTRRMVIASRALAERLRVPVVVETEDGVTIWLPSCVAPGMVSFVEKKIDLVSRLV